MKIQVVTDADGRILSIHQPGDIGHSPSGIGKAGIVAAPGQRVHVMDLPKALQDKPILELHQQCLVRLEGNLPRLIQAKEFKGPLQGE